MSLLKLPNELQDIIYETILIDDLKRLTCYWPEINPTGSPGRNVYGYTNPMMREYREVFAQRGTFLPGRNLSLTCRTARHQVNAIMLRKLYFMLQPNAAPAALRNLHLNNRPFLENVRQVSLPIDRSLSSYRKFSTFCNDLKAYFPQLRAVYFQCESQFCFQQFQAELFAQETSDNNQFDEGHYWFDQADLAILERQILSLKILEEVALVGPLHRPSGEANQYVSIVEMIQAKNAFQDPDNEKNILAAAWPVLLQDWPSGESGDYPRGEAPAIGY